MKRNGILVLISIFIGIGGSLLANGVKNYAHYTVIGDAGDKWIVQTVVVNCSGGSMPCSILSYAAPDANNEISKSSVVSVISFQTQF